MLRVIKTLLVVSLCLGVAYGLPTPKCGPVKGLTDPQNPEPYGSPKPGDCTPCKLAGCAICTEDYQKCDVCSPAYGPTKLIPCTEYDGCPPTPEACAACPSGCGACSLDATQCMSEIQECPTATIAAAPGATEGEFMADGLCTNPPGSTGNGYVATYTALVQDGICIDCGDTTPYSESNDGSQQGFGARIPPYCDMLSVALNVAANAFPGCPSPTFVLTSTCHSSRSLPGQWEMDFTFDGSCDGVSKQVQVVGGWITKVPDDVDPSQAYDGDFMMTPLPASKWTYASKDEATTSPASSSPSTVSPTPSTSPTPGSSPAAVPPPTNGASMSVCVTGAAFAVVAAAAAMF